MNRALWIKCIREAALLWLALAIGLFAMAWLRVWVVSQLDTGTFRQLIDLLPADWRRFASVDFEWLITYTGRVALTLDEPIIVGCIAIWAIARGSDVVSGELSRGTMEMLLAQPVSRMRVFWTQNIVTLTGVVLLALAAWAGMFAGVQTTTVTETTMRTVRVPYSTFTMPAPRVGVHVPGHWELPLPWVPPVVEEVRMRDRIPPGVFWPGVVNLVFLGWFVVALSAMASALDKYRWRTIGIVTGFYLASAMLKIVGLAIEDWSWLAWFSFFSCYEPEVFIAVWDRAPEQLTWWYLSITAGPAVGLGLIPSCGILFLLSALCFAIGATYFHRRDLPAPL